MRKQTKQKLIYLRYILPGVLIALMLIVAFLPCYRFIAEGELRETMSLSTLVSNSWEECREILFAKTGQTRGQLLFARTILIMIILFVILYIAALAVSIWSAIVAIKLFASDDEDGAERARLTFITFVPNRIILTLIQALAAPVALIPYFMPLIYRHALSLNVKFTLATVDPFIFILASLVAILTLSIITAPYERRFDADVFKKRKIFSSKPDDTETQKDDYVSIFETEAEKDGDYEKMREEQAARIRELFRNRNNDENQDNSG